jgi:hypothetical protein
VSNEEQAHKIGVLKHYCSMNAKERSALRTIMEVAIHPCRGCPLGPYRRPVPRVLGES